MYTRLVTTISLLFFAVLVLATGGFFVYQAISPQQAAPTIYGAGYAPVTGFQTQTTSRISASASTIPVASVSDKAGNVIVPSSISASSTVRMYFNLEAGSAREEPIYCTGISGLNLTGCVRGISFQGSDLTASSTIAQIHNAGSSVIMTNLGVMYGNEYVSISGNQTVFDRKTFNELPRVTSTSAVPTSNDQLTTWYAAQTLVAGGLATTNASTTLGLKTFTGLTNCLTTGVCFGINASGTLGLGFFSDSGLNNSIGIKATSTQFTFDHLGDLAIDLTKNFIWTGTHTFSAGLAQIFVPTPTDPGHATNKSYVDANISYNTATGTAAVTIAAGQALAINTTSTLVLASSAASSTSFGFVGFATAAATSGTQVTYVKSGGIIDSVSGLSPGKPYFLGTAGAVATTPGTISARVGVALSANRLQVVTPSFYQRVSGSTSVTFNGGVSTITLGFTPTRIDFICNTGSPGGMGWWMLNSDGTSSTGSVGNDQSTAGNWMTTNYDSCKWNEGAANTFSINTTRTASGFTLTSTSIGGSPSRTIYYTATYDDISAAP